VGVTGAPANADKARISSGARKSLLDKFIGCLRFFKELIHLSYQ
jgi:hypothetical protein